MRENILGWESIKDKFHFVHLDQMTTEKGCENTVSVKRLHNPKAKIGFRKE